MHLRAGVIKRRNAQEYIVFLLIVMVLLHLRRMGQRAVLVQDRFRKSGRPGREIDRAEIIICKRYLRIVARAVRYFPVIVFRVIRRTVSDKEQQSVLHECVFDVVQSLDKLNTEKQYRDICQFHAVLDLRRIISEIQRNSNGSAL